MRQITPELTPELLAHFGDPTKVGSSEPYKVQTFRELVEHSAKLAYRNKDHMLFYRGQIRDYRNKAGASTLYPKIYRGEYLKEREVRNRFDILNNVCEALKEAILENHIDGGKDVRRRELIQWSILQHYEVCLTPLLDITQSLRVACSFATMKPVEDWSYIFVFGLPYLTNRITINSEHDLVVVRLLSICPPIALRPYFQEGYVAGTDGITTDYEVKTELDFNNRLIAKYMIPNTKSFWGSGFAKIPEKALYPEADQIYDICQNIKEIAERSLQSGELGDFMKKWIELEQMFLEMSQTQTQKIVSVGHAIRKLAETGIVDQESNNIANKLREFRNHLVHNPKSVSQKQVQANMILLDEILGKMKSNPNWKSKNKNSNR